jgi:hypothetical protein
MEIAFGCKSLLRPAAGLAKPANIEGNNFNRIIFLHPYEDVAMLAIALQGIASITLSRILGHGAAIQERDGGRCWNDAVVVAETELFSCI